MIRRKWVSSRKGKKGRLSFKTKIILAAVLTVFIPLIISYWIFIQDQLESMDKRIRTNLEEAAFIIKQSPLVQEKLAARENDLSLQQYTLELIDHLQDVDIIVLADMTGEKYSHLDERQIGQIFVGEDKRDVLKEGVSYYSLEEGSMGTTLRRFEPIMKGGIQVGFVMAGKYYADIYQMNQTNKARYALLFLTTFTGSIILATLIADRIKRAILDMEPQEIARLYQQDESIFNGVQEGIIALDSQMQLLRANSNAQRLMRRIGIKKLMELIEKDLKKREPVSFREYAIEGMKLFVNIQPIWQGDSDLGTIITLMDEQEIIRAAKEITGIEEANKNLRATIHEFKNNLHVILGLLQLQEYSEAEKYIMKLQDAKKAEQLHFESIEDQYVRALLLSRMVMAKEKQITMQLSEGSQLKGQHRRIASQDLVTIIGNLLENAFEACILQEGQDKKIVLSLKEDEESIEIKVRDNGIPIPKHMEDRLFELGISSKGENRGNGLYLIKNNVDFYHGRLTAETLQNGEKQFTVILLKEQENEQGFNH